MAIEIVPVILLPTMDASRFERCTFALEERKATMTIYMKELEPFVIFFGRLCWHRVTPFEQCNSTITEGCHLAVAEIKGSPALKAHVNKYQLAEKDARHCTTTASFSARVACTKRLPPRLRSTGSMR